MEDASAYIKPLSKLRSEIVPFIYPAIFSLNLYPELRECAVQEAMGACRIKKENQLSVMQ
jgi:hypothetical protein